MYPDVLVIMDGGFVKTYRDIALTASCLEYEPTIPAKFMIGTDQVASCHRKM